MTRRIAGLILLFMSMLIGWVLGFIKAPYIRANNSFWVGFAACLAIIGFMITIFWMWNKNKVFKPGATVNNPETGTQKQKSSRIGIFLSIVLFALLFVCIRSYFNIQSINVKLNLANEEINELRFNVDFEQQKNNISLLLDLINKLDSAKLHFKDTSVLNNMIDRIATLSSSFKIHQEWDIENKVHHPLSTERGLLLLALVRTKMDSTSFNKIKKNVNFFWADLRNADLHGLDLSGIDLQNANLAYANLQGINLNYANLSGANMLGVNLNQASLVGANLTSAKLNWAKINEADLQMTKLDSADFSNVTAQKSKLNHASLIQAVLCNAIFYEADFNHCLLMSTNMSNANLSQTDLVNVDVYSTNLSSIILNGALIRKNWIEHLKERNNSGVNAMLEKFLIVSDSLSIKDSIIYRLTPKMQ